MVTPNMPNPRSNNRDRRRRPYQRRRVVHRPGSTDAVRTIGTRGLRNLAGRINEEYLNRFKAWRKEADTYIEMKDDLIIAAALDAVKLPLLAADFDVTPASDSLADQFAADFLWQNLNQMHRQSWRSYVSDSLEAIDFGWSLGEIVLEKRIDGRMWLRNIEPRAQETLERWEFDDNDGVTHFIQRDPDRGSLLNIPIDKTIHITFRGRKGNPQGKALLREIWRHWFFLRELENFEGIGLERNVGGMPVAELPEEPLSDDDLNALDKALRDLRIDESMFLRVPHGTKVTPYAGGSPAGSIGPVIERKQKEILMRVFAQFLKLGMDNVGTQALVQGSQDFFTLGLIAVQQEWVEVWNQQLVPYIFRFNSFPGMSGFPEIKWNNPGQVDIGGFLDAYSKGVTAKLLTPIREDEEHARSIMDLPDLPEGEGEGPRDPEQAPAAGGPGMPAAPPAPMSSLSFSLGYQDPDRCLLPDGDLICCCPRCNSLYAEGGCPPDPDQFSQADKLGGSAFACPPGTMPVQIVDKLGRKGTRCKKATGDIPAAPGAGVDAPADEAPSERVKSLRDQYLEQLKQESSPGRAAEIDSERAENLIGGAMRSGTTEEEVNNIMARSNAIDAVPPDPDEFPDNPFRSAGFSGEVTPQGDVVPPGTRETRLEMASASQDPISRDEADQVFNVGAFQEPDEQSIAAAQQVQMKAQGRLTNELTPDQRAALDTDVASWMSYEDPDELVLIGQDYNAVVAGEADPDTAARFNAMAGVSREFYGEEPRTLYRGVTDVDNPEVQEIMAQIEEGQDVEIPAHFLTSWTTDPEVASAYASDRGSGFVVSRDVTPEEVAMVPALFDTDMEQINQKEIVVHSPEQRISGRVHRVTRR